MTEHGVVIGKFYPPHAGHHLLVDTAARVSRLVTVVVMASHVESIPLPTRVQWMREAHADQPQVFIAGIGDDLPVDYQSEEIWAGHVQLVRAAVAMVTSEPITAVFTSEAYGAELARRLGATHVAVDPERRLVPMSATAVRSDPAAAWDFLAPAVRAWFARRVVLVGAESTGKTTLAQALAQRLRGRGGAHGLTRWVPEYGRDFTIGKLAAHRARAVLAGVAPPAMATLEWCEEDFIAIAERQQDMEEAEARLGGPVLICDTDAFATAVWHERYLHSRSAAVETLSDSHPHHLYLLTHPDDVPFEQDGIRDGQSIRSAMTELFVRRLDETGRTWRWIRGGGDAREAAALAAIDHLLSAGWGLAAPL
jgi:NadR type nicotinamide-nucleotide adenylyltransferase